MQHNRHYDVHPVAVPPYGAPGCDCPLPEKVSEDCPIHGTPHNADYVDTSLHGEGLCDRSCCTPMSEVYRMDGRRADGTRPA
jgi:hypothetical protein